MKSFEGYLKRKLGDSYTLLAGGGHYSLDNILHGNSYGTMENIIDDCNSVDRTGVYSSSGFSNRPSGVSNWGTLLNLRLYQSSNSYHRQLFFDCYGTDKIWTRSKSGSIWTDWCQILTTKDWKTATGFDPANYVTAVAVTDDATNHPNQLRYVKNGTSNYFTVPFATNATNATNARYVIGDNTAASASGALLQSGSGRANNSSGDTWLFLDNQGGTSSPYGIKHNQVDDSIEFIGGGTVRSKMYLSNNGIYSPYNISGGNLLVNTGYAYLRKPQITDANNNIISDNRIYTKCGNNAETTGLRFYSVYYPDSNPLRNLYRVYFMNEGSYIDYNSYPADTQGSTNLVLGTSTKIGTAGSAYGAIYLYSRQTAGNTGLVFSGSIYTAVLTSSRTYILPDATGTVALTSDIPGTKNININGSNYALYTSAGSLPTIYAPTASGTGFLKSSVSNNVVTWSYDNSTYSLSNHSHTFAQVTSKLTHGNEFNFIDAEQATIWFNYRRASDSAATTATTEFNFGQGTATSAYANLKAGGFIKNGSSSAKLLLGDGTDKALNTLLTAVGRTTNTNNLYVTVGGNTLSVALGARAWDSTAYLPLTGGIMTGAIQWDQNYNNTTETWNLPATGSAAGIYPMNAISNVGAPSSYCIGLTVSGRYAFQLASPAMTPSRLYVRSYTDTTWREIITSNNIGSQSVSFANDVPFPYSSQAHYGTTTSNNKYIKVTINSDISYMISFVLRVYTNYKSYDVVISGYHYGNNHWYSPNAQLYASAQDTFVVSFGYDADNNLWVVVPVEHYTGASVFNCVNGYYQINKTEKEIFVITQVDAIPDTVQYTVTAKRPLRYDENAVTATKWAATKTFTIGATGRNVDGSANASWSLADIFGSTAIGSVAQPVYWSGSAFAATQFTAGSSIYGEHNANNIKSNGLWYYSSNGPATSLGATTADGGLYSQAYSTAWAAQIAQDYRNGRLFIRGLNNGSWSDWLNVRDSGNTYVTDGVGYIGNSEVTTVRRVIGNNDSASLANALLQSGPNRANTAAGNTWIFWDTYSGTSSFNGIQHDQVNDIIRFYGAGTTKVQIGLTTGDISATRNIVASGQVTGSNVVVNNGWLFMYRPVTTAEDTGVVTADNRIYWKYGNNSNVYMRYYTTYNPTTEVIGSTFCFPGYGTLAFNTVPIGTQGSHILTIGSGAKRGNAINALYGMLRLMSQQTADNTGTVYYGQILTALLTANRTYYLPDAAGTIALTSNIPGNFVKSGSTAAAGLVPSPGTTAGTTKFLREDATWQVPTNTTYKLTINGTTNGDSTNGVNLGTINVFKASGTNHAIGLVPDPGATAGTTKFLREDGSWQVPAYPTNTWRKVLVAGTERLGSATNTGDLKFVNGTYTTVTWNATNKTIQYDCNLIRSGTASNLTSLDVTKSFIYVTLSANVAASAFTLSAAMTVGQCLTVLVYNSGSATINITVPSSWKSLDGYTLICGATKFIEISIVKYASGANDYILSSKAQ